MNLDRRMAIVGAMRRAGMRGDGVATFNPLALGTKIWWAGDRGRVDVATKIATWLDQSGNGFDLSQGNDANRPLNTRTVNGLVAPDFTGSPVRMASAADVSTVLGTPSILEINAVWIADTLGAGTIFNGPNIAGQDTNNWWTHSISNAALYGAYSDGGGVARAATTGNAPSTGVVYRSRSWNDGSNVNAKLGSGAAVPTACVGAAAAQYTTNKWLVGWNASQNAFLDGAVCEVVVMTRQLSALERLQLDAWFLARWSAQV